MAKKSTAPAAPETLAAAEQPYYLQRAHIKDFRSIRDAKVEFKPGLNIIIGANGSGKTNFVRCIQNALGKLESSFDGEVELDIKGRDIITVKPTKYSTVPDDNFESIELGYEPRERLIELSADGVIFYGETFLSSQLKYKSEQTTPNKFISLLLTTILHGVPIPYPLVDSGEDFYIHPRSVGLNTFEKSLFVNGLASSISNALLYSAINRKPRFALPTQKQVSVVLEEVENFYLEYLAPQLNQFTPIKNLRFTASYSTYTNSTQNQVIVKGISLDFKVGNDWLPFSALSSGTQRLFYIISESIASSLRFSKIGANQIITHDKIILLEEPELGIHPHQLHLLLSFLREQSDKHQLIITTHSPQVLDMLKEDELDRITICELDEKKGTQFRKLKKAQLTDARRYMKEVGFLSDYWRLGDLEASK